MRRAGFSLASIMLLTAVVAVFLAAVPSIAVRHGRINLEALGWLAIVGGAIGLAVGAAIGLGQLHRARGILLGLASGAIFGAATMVLLVAPYNLALAAVGSLVIVLFAAVVRICSAKRPRGWQA